jgi:transposase
LSVATSKAYGATPGMYSLGTGEPKDEYRCPAEQCAIWRYIRIEDGMTLHKYWSSACPRCPIKSKCTTGDCRRIARWEHENILDAMQKRLNRTPEASRIRRQTIEHPFGTIKV